MEKGAVAGTQPIGVNVEAGKDYWWCACGKLEEAAVLRRLAQGLDIFAGAMEG